jgi:sialate O-acetylesterase
MVLQRDKPIALWGKAAAGEMLEIQLLSPSSVTPIQVQPKTITTPASGNWKVFLDALPAGGPYLLSIQGQNTVTVKDVMIGEVWQCAGQSNMDTRLSFYPGYADTIKVANHPQLRFYTIRQPGETTRWEVVSPSNAGKLSAMGFFFGREIQKTQNVAVGLVVTAVGGTFLSQWMDPQAIASDPVLSNNGDATNGDMYQTWVKPVEGYTQRGVVWIQGEQDRKAALAPLYRDRFQRLIQGWRKIWDQGDFPFYFVQLANYGTASNDPTEESTTSVIREGQRLALTLPHTAMVVAIDIGAADDLHFPNKREAGLRLALPAQALIYGKSDLVFSGPLYRNKTAAGSKIHLHFSHVGSGLMAKGGDVLKGFAIASASGVFVEADAVIHGDTVTVSHAQVSQPTRVRYAYNSNPTCNLYNKEGLPASPFQTEGVQLPTFLIQPKQKSHENTRYGFGIFKSLPSNSTQWVTGKTHISRTAP